MKNEIFGMDDNLNTNDVSIDELESERQLIFQFVFDKSSSMFYYEDVVRKCLNLYKQALLDSKQTDEMLVSITKFATFVELGGYTLVNDMPVDYNTNGTTALYEAIVQSVKHLITENEDGYMDTLRKGGVNVRAIFIVFSDGYDNESKHLLSEAKKQIAFLNEKEITTVFVEFGDEAKGIADSLGFNNILSTDATESELRNIFNVLSRSSISASKSAGNISQDAFFV